MRALRPQLFGDLLRAHRRAAGLTQEQLAARAGLSARAVGDLERGAKHRPHRDTIRQLAAALSLSATRLGEFEAAARRAAPATRPAAPASAAPAVAPPGAAPRHNLPAATTSFIGRERELAQVRGLLWRAATRLVTLTGAGGSGKTRLALEVAGPLLDEFADGVYFVDLAPLTDPALVVVEIAQTLGVRETSGEPLLESLKSALREKQMLLLLDNFEHLLPAAPLVAALLAAAGRVKVLVTSRVRLRLRGEHEFAVPPLAVPQPGSVTVAQLGQYEAARLFVARAAAQADFVPTDENAPVVAEICVRLDGLPLALELAAARLKLLSLQGLLARLDSRLQLLTGGAVDLPARQQTIRQTIAWSYELLSRAEQRLFGRLAVFVGGCTLAAAAAVCAGDPDLDVVNGLASLLDKSLVYRRDGGTGEPRYLMLATIREYARETLEESGEAEPLLQQHALYFMQLAEEAEQHLMGAQQQAWLERLEEEHDNIRATLRWATAGRGPQAIKIGLRTAGAFWLFWRRRGYFSEGRVPIQGLVEQATTCGCCKAEMARALNAAADLAYMQGDCSSSTRALVEDALALGREVADVKSIATSLNILGHLAAARQDYPAARSFYEQSLGLRRELGDQWGVAGTLGNLAHNAQDLGDYPAARSLYAQSLGLRRAIEDQWGIAWCLQRMGELAYEQDDYPTARALHEQSLALTRKLGDKNTSAFSLCRLGDIALIQGDYLTAYSLYDETLALWRDRENKTGITHALDNLGDVAFMQEDYPAACSLHQQSLQINRDIGDKEGIAKSLAGLGEVAVESGQPRRGARLLGAADALLEAAATVRPRHQRIPYERAVASARAQLGEEACERARQEGRAISMEQAIVYALADSAAFPGIAAPLPPAALPPPRGDPSAPRRGSSSPAKPVANPLDALTAREAEVLRLLAASLSDGQIADRLVLSRRTVQAHVRTIYAKLNVANRSAATRYAIEHGFL